MFKKLASPALRKQMEHKETGAAAGKHPVKGLEEQEEDVKEAPMTGEQGEVRPMRAATTTPAVGGKGPGGLGVEESTGMRAGVAGGGAARGEMGGLDVEEASGWTGAELLAKDIPHKTTVGPKMKTLGKPPTEEKPSQPTPAVTTTADKGLEEEEEEEMHVPQTPFTTPAMAVAAAADTSQGATKAPFASDLDRASGGPVAGGKAKAPPSEEAAAAEFAQEAYRPGLSVLPPHGMGGPSPGEVSKMKPAGTERKEEKEKAAPTPMQQEIRGPLAPSAEAPTFGTTDHAATTAPSPGLAGSFSPDIGGGAAGLEGGPEAQPTTFETTPAAGGLVGLGTASSSSSSPLLGTSAEGVGSTLGKKPEETVVAPEEAGAAVGPSAGVALPSPAEAAEAINRGIERGEHVLETVARRFLTSIREHAPSLASLGAAANVGIENVEQRASEVEGFVESVISKTAAGIRARLPSPAQGLETTNAGVEQVGLVAERAERIAQDTVEHAARAIRARFPSPAQGAEQANMAVEKAEDWVGHAERIAEDVASRAVAAVHEMLPSPAKGLAATNEGIAAGEHMIKSAAGTLLEKLPSLPSAPKTGTTTTTTTTTTGGTTGTTAASILSPAAILDTVNRGIEAAAETVKGVLPGASTSTSTSTTTTASTTAETPFSGLSIKAPIESVKAMMPSTPFPTPVAGTETGAETGAGLSSALSPAAIAASINKGLERGGEAVRGPMETITETVSSTLGALPTLLPSPAQAAETINRAIDTGAPTQGTGEQGWEGEAGAGGGSKTAGFGEAYDQRAREAETRRMLEETEHAAPHEQGGVVTGAVPAGTRQRQLRMPQASLFGAVENVLESMHEAFARGVRMTGGGAREQPTPMVSKEEVEMGAEEGLGAKAPVVIQGELTMETEGAAGEVQTVHVSKTIIK